MQAFALCLGEQVVNENVDEFVGSLFDDNMGGILDLACQRVRDAMVKELPPQLAARDHRAQNCGVHAPVVFAIQHLLEVT